MNRTRLRHFSLHLIRKQRFSRWTASANGRPRVMASAAAIGSIWWANSISRTRSGCSIPRSPTSPGSGSMPANTSSLSWLSTANGRILREGIFDRIWIQPAAGDAGGALGAALFAWHQVLGNARQADNMNDSQRGSYLGPAYTRDEIHAYLQSQNIPFTELTDEDLPAKIADLIKAGKVIGWFYGRMEFGPRALGARSIISDAQSPKMQEEMNLKIKFRESFRPFAPSVLRERVADWFELESESPYMLLVAPVAKERRRKMTDREQKLFGLQKLLTIRSTIPAVTHVDYSARVQTVTEKHQPMYYRTIKNFEEKYGCPVIINTSFNVRGEPIVEAPEHAYLCFMRTNMDYLLLGNFLLEKREQKPLEHDIEWLKEFELD